MIFEAETALLLAVRARLIDALKWPEHEIDVELDDLGPAMTGQKYIAISPAGATMGRYSPQGDAIHHNVFGCRVCLFHRATDTPRDKRRNVFLDRLTGLNAQLTQISKAIRFNYAVIQQANANMQAEGLDCEFLKPLVPVGADPRPVTFTHDVFDSHRGNSGDPVVGLKRGINFGNAEFIGRPV